VSDSAGFTAASEALAAGTDVDIITASHPEPPDQFVAAIADPVGTDYHPIQDDEADRLIAAGAQDKRDYLETIASATETIWLLFLDGKREQRYGKVAGSSHDDAVADARKYTAKICPGAVLAHKQSSKP
jgi:hypothetical protein